MEVAIIVESRIASKIDYSVVAGIIIFSGCRSCIVAAWNAPTPISFLSYVIVTIKNGVNVPMLPECLPEFLRILQFMERQWIKRMMMQIDHPVGTVLY